MLARSRRGRSRPEDRRPGECRAQRGQRPRSNRGLWRLAGNTRAIRVASSPSVTRAPCSPRRLAKPAEVPPEHRLPLRASPHVEDAAEVKPRSAAEGDEEAIRLTGT